jgi:hypothetical protein
MLYVNGRANKKNEGCGNAFLLSGAKLKRKDRKYDEDNKTKINNHTI